MSCTASDRSTRLGGGAEGAPPLQRRRQQGQKRRGLASSSVLCGERMRTCRPIRATPGRLWRSHFVGTMPMRMVHACCCCDCLDDSQRRCAGGRHRTRGSSPGGVWGGRLGRRGRVRICGGNDPRRGLRSRGGWRWGERGVEEGWWGRGGKGRGRGCGAPGRGRRIGRGNRGGRGQRGRRGRCGRASMCRLVDAPAREGRGREREGMLRDWIQGRGVK